MKTINHWVDGVPTAGTAPRRTQGWDPATGGEQGRGVQDGKEDVAVAVASAQRAFADWSQVSLSKRTKVLFAFRELVNARTRQIAEAISDEHGKVVADAQGEVQRGLEVVEFACGIASALK